MARQNINLGTSLNDGTGDKLRDAVKKINDNLIELYVRTGGDATLTGTGVTVAGNVVGVNGAMTITTNNNGNLTIAAPTVLTSNLTMPAGSVKINTVETDLINSLLVNGNAKIKGNTVLGDNVGSDTLTINGTISSTLVPTASLTYDLGTSSIRYRDAYIGGTINAGVLTTSNVQVTGGSINNTAIGDATPVEGRFSILRTINDAFLGDLLVRDNMISNRVPNEDIEIRPDGTGNVYVSTKVIVGPATTQMVNPYLQITGDDDTFTQVGVQNINPGKFACSDSVVFNDQGSDFFNFVCMGHNNSGWDGSLQYVYFLTGSNASAWTVGQTVYQIDPSDGSSILAQGVIDEKVTNPLNASEIRIRVSQIYTGTTGIFEQGSVAGVVYNSTVGNSAMPREHLLETITSNGNVTYNLGTSGTLNGSTARAVFGPTVIMATDSLEVKVNGVTQDRGVDWTVEFNRIRFYTVPTAGATITLRQYPEANYPFTIGTEADAYIYNNGNKLTLGTMTGHDLVFHTNGTRYTAEAGRLKGDTKNWIFGGHANDTDGQPDTGEKVQVHGNLRVNGDIIVQDRTVDSSVGIEGDKAGMVAIDNSYIYHCVADYDGSTNIWTRVALSSTPW